MHLMMLHLLLMVSGVSCFVFQKRGKIDTIKRCINNDDIARLEALLITDPKEKLESLVRNEHTQSGLPVVEVTKWTYFPGMREILRIHAPALTFIMSDLILSSKDRRYVHLLKGNAIGVEMKVLDVVHYHDEMFVLVHCLRRVRIIEKEEEKKFNLRRFVQIEPIFDREEILAFAGNISLACKDAATWQNIDDPIDDFSPTWLRDGGAGTPRSFFKKERMGNTQKLNSNDMNDSLESQIWQQLDRFVQLVRTSRTSGQFDLPPLIQDLRKYASFLPPHRRRLRLSFAIAEMILDLDDRASARQLFLDCTSTADRLQLIIDRLLYDNNQLSAALALEAIRRGANKKHHDK